MGMPIYVVQRLVQEYDEQFVMYTQMLDAARQLQRLCQGGDFHDMECIHSLNKFLEIRQLQMQGIEESQNTTAQFYEGLEAHLGLEEITSRGLAELFPSVETRRLKELINALEPLLREIVSLDEESQKHLNHKLGRLKKEALSLRKGRDANLAYKKPAGGPQEGVFMEEKKF